MQCNNKVECRWEWRCYCVVTGNYCPRYRIYCPIPVHLSLSRRCQLCPALLSLSSRMTSLSQLLSGPAWILRTKSAAQPGTEKTCLPSLLTNITQYLMFVSCRAAYQWHMQLKKSDTKRIWVGSWCTLWCVIWGSSWLTLWCIIWACVECWRLVTSEHKGV